MDTRYWGPSGWRLLHLISFAPRQRAAAVCRFFEVLPFVLPCKYCRYSLSSYYEADPPECAIREERLPRWLWRIHNDVNAKIRQQGLKGVSAATEADPPFAKVRAVYEDRLAAGCSRTVFDGWEFLFSVAESHPFGRQGRSSTPIEDHPPLEDLAKASPLERNKWNVMEPAERLSYYTLFWKLLPEVLPFSEWATAWKRAAKRSEQGSATAVCRADCLKGVWAIRRAMEEELELLNQTTYSSLCKELRTFRSGCGLGARGKTCRRKRGT